MTPRTEEQFKKIRVEKRQLILDAALELFADQGYHSTSISQLATKAGISKGLLYNYFENKESVLKTIIDEGFNDIFSDFINFKENQFTNEHMKKYINHMFDSLTGKQNFWKFYFQIILQSSAQAIVKEKLETFLMPVMEIMTQFFENNGYDDPYTEALILGALFDGIGMDYAFAPEYFPLEKVKKNLLNKYCNIK
ncbi:MAG: TetR/AcrR family transcriptional regulator [Bacteroidales bacterium]|nr:TetR/AcrR family transcriptional regulator [Bacteroidales bacterium]